MAQDETYFSRLSDAALNHAIQDIQSALEAVGSHDPQAQAKYSDQLYAAKAVQKKRQGGNHCPTCGQPVKT